MAKVRIGPDRLRHLVESGLSQAEIARRLGVSDSAVCQRLKKLKMLTSRVVGLEKAGQIVEEKLSAAQRLEKVQDIIDRQLSWAVRKAEEPGVDRVVLVQTILNLAGEIRQQLNLQLNITRALVDLKVVKEFQQSVIEVISSESPETAGKIIARLKDRRALRPSAQLPGLAPFEEGGQNALME